MTEQWNMEAEMLNSIGDEDEMLGLHTQSQLDAGDSLYSSAVATGAQFSKTFQNENLNGETFYRRDDSIAIRETIDD